jgi:hypothetical protein
MGVLYRYFSASTDAEAARAISFPGGPARPPQSEVSPRDRQLRRRATAALPESGTALTGRLDPVVQMWTLEAHLTGRHYNAITAGPRPRHMVASADGGQPFVMALTDELKDAVVSADQDQLRSAAGPWSQTEEFFGQGDPDVLTGRTARTCGASRPRQRQQPSPLLVDRRLDPELRHPGISTRSPSLADRSRGRPGELRAAPVASPLGTTPSGVRAGPPRLSGCPVNVHRVLIRHQLIEPVSRRRRSVRAVGTPRTDAAVADGRGREPLPG